MGKKIYLAIPYSGIEEDSFKIANEVAAKLMNEGHVVYSPISHNHPIAVAHDLPRGWDYWKDNDTEFVKWADELHLVIITNYHLDGEELCRRSKGVTAELEIAKELGKPIKRIYHAFT